MKLRICYRPWYPLFFLAGAAATFCTIGAALGGYCGAIAYLAGIFFAVLAALTFYACLRIVDIERPLVWDTPERLLVVAPHQDDCVITAGGLGLRNVALGGATRIIYLVQEKDATRAQVRADEVESAWRLAGLRAEDLVQLDLLPARGCRNPERVRQCRLAIAEIIGEYRPSAIVIPIFEGGHVHHDIANYVVTSLIEPFSPIKVYEAPEYSPYVSLARTPHKIISLCTRWLFGLVAYYGPPDGIDDRQIGVLRLSTEELATRRRMLLAFKSQNADALALAHGYSDRLVLWHPRPYRARPFPIHQSFLAFVTGLSHIAPTSLVRKIFPVQRGTFGCEPQITNLDIELGESLDQACRAPPARSP